MAFPLDGYLGFQSHLPAKPDGPIALKTTLALAITFGWLAVFALAHAAEPSSLSSSSQIPASQRLITAKQTADKNPFCKSVGSFYWEIGDRAGILASGSTGNARITRATELPIASASKWFFGAYVVERLKGQIDAETQKFLKLTSGYNSLTPFPCFRSKTAADCENRRNNGAYTASSDGKFYYNGGHFQKWAVDHGLGQMNSDELTQEFKRVLGPDIDLHFKSPQLAGGMEMTAAAYAQFLQKILRGKLLISKFLGVNPTCTLPAKCSTALKTPVPRDWHYSYGHWIEDDAAGDGAFSSAGAFGFYPWIDAKKTYYGVLAVHNFSLGESAAIRSVECGQQIRKAFMTGMPQ